MFSALHTPALVAYLTTMAPYLAVASFALTILALIFLIIMSRRIERVSLGEHGELEKTLTTLARNVSELQTFRTELEVYLKQVEARVATTLRGVGVVRFNAFANSAIGGNQSFAVAFLDEKQNGVVFSTLYSRDRVGVYAKPVVTGESTFALTPEEEEALKKAIITLDTRRTREH